MNAVDNQRQQQQQHQQQRWSFRRFGSHTEAQSTSDTWDDIYRYGPDLVAQVDSRKGELYEADSIVSGELRTNVAELPNNTTVRDLGKHIKTTIEAIHRSPVVHKINEAMGESIDVRPKDVGDEGARVVVEMSRVEWERFVDLLSKMDKLTAGLVKRVVDTASIVRSTQKSLKTLDAQLKEFIATVWGINAERAKAFPPFFTDLGPLHASVYGLGCMTSTTTTSAPTSSASAKKNNSSEG